MLDQDTIDNQQEQLAVHRRRLAYLFEQQATLGAYTPPYVVLDVEKTQVAIREIKALLREHSVAVEDHPDDDRPVQVAAPLPPALHQLRAPVGDFVGREREIEQLVQALSKAAAGGAAAAISGVRGMGGIGKTELAYATAQQLTARFPDAQLLVELRGAGMDPLSPAQALQTLIRAFEREAKLPDDLAQLQALYRDKLTGKRALILADDARDAAQVRPLLPPAGCGLLVTSRNRFSVPGMTALDLGTLPPQEAEQLLREICERIGEHASTLAKLCGYLPLALRVSASLLKSRPSRRVADYLKQLGDERTRLAHLRDPGDPALDVEASLLLSYTALEQAAQTVLRHLSVFAASFEREAAQAVVEVPPSSQVDTVLEDLCLLSLLEYDEALERYSLHDLVHAFAAARLEDAEAVRLRYARHYAQVASHAEYDLYLKGNVLTGLALFDRERTHIDAGWGWALARAGEQEADALLLDFANATAYIGELRYDTRRERIPHLEAQRAAAQRLRRRDHEGNALGNLGNAYAALGDARHAIDFFQQVLLIDREIGDRRGEGATLGNLGSAYAALGDARKAIDFYQQALLIDREIGERRAEGAVLGNLGNAYADLGDARQAIDFFQQHLALARQLGDRRGEGAALGNLGLAYAALGDARQAIDFFQQALLIDREIGDRRGEGADLGNLGNAYYALGDARQAIDFYQQLLEIVREIGERRGEGAALNNLSEAYRVLGELQRAMSLGEQALIIKRAIEHRYGECVALNNLSQVAVGLGDPDRAIDLGEQALAIASSIGDLSSEGETRHNLGAANAAKKNIHRAIEHYEQALAIRRKIGDRGGEARTSKALAHLIEEQGNLARALEAMQVCVDFEQEIGHPDAEKDTADLEQLRQRLADEGSRTGVGGQRSWWRRLIGRG